MIVYREYLNLTLTSFLNNIGTKKIVYLANQHSDKFKQKYKKLQFYGDVKRQAGDNNNLSTDF